MNWRHETWRKLFIREEGSFAALSYSARSAAAMLLKLCDDRGKIYARAREDVVESVCFRLGADRGERRMLRQAIADLLRDGYLAQGEGWLRIKNFHAAQGRTDLEPDANELRTGSDHAVTALPTGSESPANETRMSSESVANVSPSRTEECVKAVESLGSDQTVPSVPFLPSVSSSGESPQGSREPGAGGGGRILPDSPSNLIHVLGVLVRDTHPEVGLWSPGRFAEKDAVLFYERIPAADRAVAATTILARLSAYVAAPSDDGWTVKGFLDRFNELGQPGRPPRSSRGSPRDVRVGHVRAETETKHPVGYQKI